MNTPKGTLAIHITCRQPIASSAVHITVIKNGKSAGAELKNRSTPLRKLAENQKTEESTEEGITTKALQEGEEATKQERQKLTAHWAYALAC